MNAIISRLPVSAFPWVYSLKIVRGDADKFRSVIDALKTNIPSRRRKWDADGRRWLLRDGEEDTVIAILRARGVTIDIDDERQQSGHRAQRSSVALTRVSAAAQLYLLPSAPDYVVQAVYRVLAKKFHPDAGGNVAQMQALNAAVERLRQPE